MPAPFWTMGQSINNRPFVEGGVVDIDLGSVIDFIGIDFNQQLFLAVTFDNELMQPRKLFTSVPYAFNAEQLGGRDSSEYAALNLDQTITGEWTFNNIVAVATSSTQTALTISQSGSGAILDVRQGATTRLGVDSTGRVQIGPYSLPLADGNPGYILKTDGAGDVFWSADLSGSGPGGGDFIWSTSTDSLRAYPFDSALTVIIGNIATSTMAGNIFEVDGSSLFDVINISDQQELRFYDADSSNYLGIRASSSIASDILLTLPGNAGVNGQALVTDGTGNLRWDAPASVIYVNSGLSGQIPYFASDGVNLSGTSSIFIDSSGNLGIGTTSPINLLTVGYNLGNQFLVDASGNVVGGVWQGDVIEVAFGGTGTSTFEVNSLVYASAPDTIGEILAGAPGYVLKMVAGVPTWQPDLTVGGEYSHWASSSNDLVIHPTGISKVVVIGANATSTNMGQILEVVGDSYFTGSINANILSLVNALAVSEGGTGSTTPSGLLYGDGAGNILSIANNSSNWNTAYSTVNTGSANWDTAFSWGDHSAEYYFATSSGQILEVAYGGTGTSTFEANSLVYASSDDILSQILPGTNGYALVMQGGVPTWASTSPGTSHDLLSNMHSDTSPGVIARGDLITGQGLSPTWSKLALEANGYILRSNGTDTAWSTTTAITALGTIRAGTWEADIVTELFGGTGQGNWVQGDIVFATTTDNLDALSIGANGLVLQAVNGRPAWVSTTSLGIDFSGVGGTVSTIQGGTEADSSGWDGMVRVVGGSWGVVNGMAGNVAIWSDANTVSSEAQLAISRGGTGQDFSLASGFLYTDGGTMTASTTLAITYTDLTDDNSGVELIANVLSLDTSGNWSGTFDSQEGSYYLNAINLNNFDLRLYQALQGTTTDSLPEGTNNLYWTGARFADALAGTTTDALAEGTNRLYWTDTRFDTRLAATTTLNNITTLVSLSSVGTITSGSWQGDVIDVAYGGTGTSTFEANSILYASTDDTIGEILAGSPGYVLKMVGGIPQWGLDLTSAAEESQWATSSDGLMIYPKDVNDIVVIGWNATSVPGYILEVVGNAYFNSTINANTLSLVNDLAVAHGGTGSSTPSGLLYGDGAGNIVSVANNSGNWNTAYNTVNTNSGDWNTAFSWGDHSLNAYFSTSTGGALDVVYGGTGTTTFQSNSLVYADADNSLSEIRQGSLDQVLVVGPGGVPEWANAAVAAQHALLGAQHSDVEAGSPVRGDLIIASSSDNWAKVALGPTGYILRSNGTDALWSTTTAITSLGTINVGRWQADIIDIAYGGTGASTATGARENLGLDEVYKFGINATGTTGYVWQSDGDGRGKWVATSTLGLGGSSGDKASKFIGTTTGLSTGSFATSTLVGYAAANDLCNYEYPGSHFCRVYDILVSVEQDDISNWTNDASSAWVAEGPPGYTSDSNDCSGWTVGTADFLGAYWKFNANSGGSGWLINCGNNLPLACCSRQ